MQVLNLFVKLRIIIEILQKYLWKEDAHGHTCVCERKNLIFWRLLGDYCSHSGGAVLCCAIPHWYQIQVELKLEHSSIGVPVPQEVLALFCASPGSSCVTAVQWRHSCSWGHRWDSTGRWGRFWPNPLCCGTVCSKWQTDLSIHLELLVRNENGIWDIPGRSVDVPVFTR